MIATTHPVSPEEVMALADGELSSAKAATVTAHIADCEECATLAAQLAESSAAFTKWTVPDAPPSLEEAVSAAAAQVASGRKPGKPVRATSLSFRNWRLWAIGGSGALAATLIFAALMPTVGSRKSYMPSGIPMAELREQKTPQPVPSERFGSYSYDGQSITDQESKVASSAAEGRSRSVRSLVTMNAPGGVADSNGLFHGLGDHFQNSSAIDRQAAVATAPMIAHSVSLTVQVRDLGISRTALEALLARHRGYAAQLTVNTAEGSPRSLQSSLRVPDAELAAAIAEMRALGRVETETQSGEEVTQQHADLVARLQNSRETEQRLREILAQHTGKIDDILQVEEEISRVRGEIEQMEADQKVLEHRVDFATIDLQLTEQYREQLGPQSASVPMQIRNAFVSGIRHGANTLLGILLFLEETGPTLLIWLAILAVPGFFLWRRYRRLLRHQ